MFRKPKKGAKKAGLRKKPREEEDGDDDEGDQETRAELQEARKRAKLGDGGKKSSSTAGDNDNGDEPAILHQFEAKNTTVSQKDLATSTNEYHPTDMAKVDPTRNRFLAGGNGKAADDDEDAATDDGLPFACFLCRKAFDNPIVTPCGHYYCQGCLHSYNQENKDSTCPICKKDTHGVMNQPMKLLAKKRKLVGRDATWQEFMDHSKK
ncbi:MAG: hypothetical protein SGARI_003204 [Bacillariaceae sp.]